MVIQVTIVFHNVKGILFSPKKDKKSCHVVIFHSNKVIYIKAFPLIFSFHISFIYSQLAAWINSIYWSD